MKVRAPDDLVVGSEVVPRFFALRELMGYRGRVVEVFGDEILVDWYEGEHCSPGKPISEPRRNLYECLT